ncbi:MAG: tetratricopeptide repeat protein [bacterium]
MRKIFYIIVFTVVFFIMSIQVFAQPPELQYNLAHSLFLKSNYTLSETLFNSFTTLRPEDPLAGSARFMAGETEYATGQYRLALESYKSITEKYSESANKYKKEIYFRSAECYSQLKDYEKAIKYINLLLKDYAGSYLTKDAYLLLGENMFLTENYSGAIDALNHMDDFTDYTHFDYVYYLKGRAYYEKSLTEAGDLKNDSSEAIKYFNRVKNEFPSSKIINHSEFRKANVYYAIKQYDRSIKIITGLIEKEDDYKFKILMKYFLAWNYYMTKQYNKAVSIYDTIITDNETDLLATWSEYKKGLCFEGAGDDVKALVQYNIVIDKYPNTIPSAYSQYAIAQYYYNRGNYDDALMQFNDVMSKYSVEELNRAALFMTADINVTQENFGRAKDIYERISKEYVADKFTARFLQGWCMYKSADYAGSIKIYLDIIADAAAPEEIKAKAMLKVGDDYYEMGNMGNASKYYDYVIDTYSKYNDVKAEAYYGKGWLLYTANKYEEALKVFENVKLLVNDKEIKLRADFMRANTYYVLNKFDTALDLFTNIMGQKIISKSMKDDSIFYAAWCYYRKESFQQAADLWGRFQSQITDSVKKAEAQYRIGWCYFRMNDFDKAIASFAVILDQYKNTHLYQEAILKTGDSYYNKKDYEKAIVYYKELVDNYPDHYRVGEALYGIQWSYYQLNQPEKAIELSKQFVDKYPDSSFTPEIQYRIAEHYFNNSKFDTAVTEFRRFIDKNPKNELADNAYYWMGVSYMSLKTYGEAVNAFKDMIIRYPDTPFAEKAAFKSAGCYYKQRDFTNAITEYTNFIEKYKDSKFIAEAYFNLAMSYKRNNDIINTEKWYQKLIAEYKDSELFERANMNLAYMYQDNKDYEKAIAVFKFVVELKKTKAAEAQYWIADCYNSQKDTENAIINYLLVYDNFKTEELWVISSLDAAGKLYEKNGDLKAAINTYKKILLASKLPKYTETAKKKIELLNEQYKLLNPVPTGIPVKGK